MPRGVKSELAGREFGCLFVIEKVDRGREFRGKGFPSWWSARCSCGVVGVYPGDRLVAGVIKACGEDGHTWARELAVRAGGMVSGTPEYQTWVRIRSRCDNPKHHKLPHYGGRGISVCAEWASDYRRFLADMGQRPSPTHSIERLDVNGNYEKSNCIWGTDKEQRRNRTDTVWVEYQGVRMKLADLVEDLGLSPTTIAGRLRIGWDLDRAITTPVEPRKIYMTKRRRALLEQAGASENK